MPKQGAGKALIPLDRIEQSIFVIRGQRVMLDADLAQVYGVLTERLNQQVRRNAERFPADFVFQLTGRELENLILQNASSRGRHGGRRSLPWAFTEHGAVMAANVLKSPVAVRASIQVVRAFVRFREVLASSAVLAHRLADLERRMVRHDRQFAVVFEAIRKLMEPPQPERRKPPLGF
jgi:hypothetical protein